MSQLNHISISILGLGKVGGELLRQILMTRELLAHRKGVRVDVTAVNDIRLNIRDSAGIKDAWLHQVLEHRRVGSPLGEIPVSQLFEVPQAGEILVDTTASDTSVETLLSALDRGCGVVLANKKPLCGSWSQAQKIFQSPNARWEVTVGAGLPVISTINYLRNTGDKVRQIVGCLSGTLGYLCSRLQTGESYSQIVSHALGLGYTEPDPRDDLGGMDVARKILILARTSGYSLELSDITIEALFPQNLKEIPLDNFMTRLNEADEAYKERVANAAASHEVLRYIARVDSSGGSAALTGVKTGTLPSILNGPESFISITTDRYSSTPLVVTGPGAGPAVTAAGVFEDIIELGLQMV